MREEPGPVPAANGLQGGGGGMLVEPLDQTLHCGSNPQLWISDGESWETCLWEAFLAASSGPRLELCMCLL